MRTHSEWNQRVSKFASSATVACPDCGERLPVSDDAARQAHYAQCSQAIQQSRLEELEVVIERGLKTFIEVGMALLEIRDKRLYDKKHQTFEDYCRERWHMTRIHANRLIAASEVVEILKPIGFIPQNEAQAREFNGLEPDEQKALAVLSKAVLGKKRTASGIRSLKDISQSLLKSGAITIDGNSVTLSEAMDYSLTEEQHERLLRWKQNIAEAADKKAAKQTADNQAQIDRAERTLVPGNHQNIFTGDMSLLYDTLEDNSVDLFFTDPPYLEKCLPEFTRLAELAAKKLKPGGLLLTYSGQMFLPEVMQRLATHLTYWWTFVITHEVGLAIWSRNLQVKWKPVLVYAKPMANGGISPAPAMLTDRIEGGGRSKEYHAWGQDANEATYWIEKLCPANGLVCDPYTGGGAIPLACHLTGRRWIAAEVDIQQAQIARLRLSEAAQ